MQYLVRSITGRFKNLDEPTLKMMRLEMTMLLKSWGAKGPHEVGFEVQDGFPLWAEVEFLDNIIQFELECNPYLRSELN